jgi:hypothetical protein
MIKLINFITHYKNDSIFKSDQYGHYSQGYNDFRRIAIDNGYIVVENQPIVENSVVIFRDLPKKKFVRFRPTGTIFILQIWESKLDRPSFFFEKNWLLFDLVISCHSGVSNKKHREINYFIDDEINNFNFLPFRDRKFALAMCSNRYNGIFSPRKGTGIFSLPLLQEIDKEWKNNFINIIFNRPIGLYSKRRTFLNKKNSFFELYGRFWLNKELQTWLRYFYKYLPENYISKGEYVGDKIELLGKYKFAMAFENYYNKTSYISEKIFECFRAGCVPIYSGCQNISEYIPDDCYIYVSKSDSPQDVLKKIKSIDEQSWNLLITNGKNYLESFNYKNHFSPQAFAKKLFKYVNEAIENEKVND